MPTETHWTEPTLRYIGYNIPDYIPPTADFNFRNVFNMYLRSLSIKPAFNYDGVYMGSFFIRRVFLEYS